MNYYVYIIRSISTGKFYKGYSLSPYNRLKQHNNGESRYTQHFCPWELVFIQSFDSKTEALKREKVLKKYSKKQIDNLIKSPLNEI
ncbi:GIY-YIG nuclease family protein [bacterium SCSIO 12643]|nr:GIY-YIG nuclease family protein [bacterium SCSIO 12643]